MSTTTRPSFPPGIEGLKASTAEFRKHLDGIEPGLRHIPLPVSVAVAALDLTDEQRVAVCIELRRRMGVLPDAVAVYEAEAKGRLGK